MADHLVVAGTTTNTKACKVVDPGVLLSRSTRAESQPAPYIDGQIVYFGFLDEIDTSLELKLNGFWTPGGVVNADYSDGLDDNAEFYRALFQDGGDSVGRVTVALHTGNRVLSGLLQCRRWEQVRTGPGTATVIARVVVGAGKLVA